MKFRWRIYYGDGSTFNEDDPYNAPARNVQMIAGYDPSHNWYLCRSNDFYWYLPSQDAWEGGEQFGLWDYLVQPGPKKVLFGRTVTNAEFQTILMRAYDDPEIPQKTGWRPGEKLSAGIDDD